jgi:serine/threonine protein kinase
MKPCKPGDPDKIGDIALRGRLGEGGMGTVYFGVMPDGDRVAVKTIRHDLTANTEAKDRFDREILVLGMVTGPRIAALLAASEPDEAPPWFAAEYVQGLTLSEYIQERGPLTTEMTAALGIMLAEALDDIHTAGLLHRDLKPGNVILGADGPRVIDFGLAGLIEGPGDITHTSAMLGTPVCMAPEQAASPKNLTAAADVYALGAVLMFAMTRRYPYERTTVPALLLAVADPAVAPDLTGVPAEMTDLVKGMLAHHPASRSTLADVTVGLRAILKGTSLIQVQSEFAQLTYMERDTDPPPAPAVPRASRRRLPGNPHVPTDLVQRMAEKLRVQYARSATL